MLSILFNNLVGVLCLEIKYQKLLINVLKALIGNVRKDEVVVGMARQVFTFLEIHSPSRTQITEFSKQAGESVYTEHASFFIKK